MAPLSNEVWIGILFSYVLVNIILFFINRFSFYEHYSHNANDVATRQKCSVHNALFCYCDGFTDHGVPHSIASKTKLIVKCISIRFLMRNLYLVLNGGKL